MIMICAGREEEIPNFVFLAHCIDVLTSLHAPFCIRTLAAYPFTAHWFLWLLWLPLIPILIVFWLFGQTFLASQYILDHLNCNTWVIPRHGFQVWTQPLHHHVCDPSIMSMTCQRQRNITLSSQERVCSLSKVL